MYATSFVYGGVSSEELGLYIASVNDKKTTSQSSLGAELDIKEEFIPGRIRSLFYGVSEDEPLEFDLSFAAVDVFDRYKLEEIASKLAGKHEYQWLEIDQPDLRDVRFRCILNNFEVVYLTGEPIGLTCTAHCDSPYAWEFPREYSVTVGDTCTASLNIYNTSSSNRVYEPDMEIIVPANKLSYIEESTVNITIPPCRLKGDVNADRVLDNKDASVIADVLENGGHIDIGIANVSNTGTLAAADMAIILNAEKDYSYIYSHHNNIIDTLGNWRTLSEQNEFGGAFCCDVTASNITIQSNILLESNDPNIVGAVPGNGIVRIYAIWPPLTEENISITLLAPAMNVQITNQNDNNRVFQLYSESAFGSNVTFWIDNDRRIIDSIGTALTQNAYTYIADNGYKFFRLVKGMNELEITAPAGTVVTVKCEFPKRVGG